MRKLLALVTLIALPLAAGCAVHQDEAPSAAGPAESSLSLKILATPDRLLQDGTLATQGDPVRGNRHVFAVQAHHHDAKGDRAFHHAGR